jgi:hypothetical protein
LHDRLRAREFDVGIKSVGDSEVGGTDQKEAEFRLAKLLVEFGVSASRHVEPKGILRLLDHLIVERVVASVGCEGGRDGLAEIRLVLRPPELRAVASI